MTKRIFWAILTASVLVMTAGMVLISAGLYHRLDSQILRNLEYNLSYLAKGVELNGSGYLESGLEKGVRITWVAPDGTVLYDNIGGTSEMENHAGRPEIRQAIEAKEGKSVRYSATLSQKTVYCALRLSDGSVLRVSEVYPTVARVISGMWPLLTVLVLFSLVLSTALATRLAKGIVRPLNEIDLEHPLEGDSYEELAPFLSRIEQQNRQIREQMEELRRQQEEFSAITGNMQEGFLVVDCRRRLLAFNPSALHLLGMPEAKEGQNILELNRGEPFRNALDLALQGVHNEQSMKQGERFYHLFANPVFNGKKLSGAVLVLLDVTEKEERDALRREFTANVSHELKTPLTTISGTAEILMNGMVKSEDIPHFAGNIYREAQRLMKLVQDIIRLSRLEEEDFSSRKEPVDLAEIARRTAETLQIAAEKKSVAISLDAEPAVVSGIPAILEEVVYNLCENGVQYNREGGKLEIAVKNREDGVLLSVRDTGIGIPADQQERVFERFYRVDKSRSKANGGTGLGLSIVKHGAACHGGTIHLESEVGRGTTVTILFPNQRQTP